MAYIGRSVDIGMFEKQVLTADSSTTTFALTFAVGSANSLLVVYGGVIQEPGVAYSVSGGGQQIAFSEAPATGTTTYIIYLGKQLTTPRAAGQETSKQTLTGDGTTTLFTLTDPPVVPAGIMVFVDGILQREGAGNNYVSGGSTINFNGAPDSGAEIDVYTLVKEKVSIDTVADGSITRAKMASTFPYWDASGNVSIGKASASSRLHISGSSGVNGAAYTLDIGAQQHAWYLSDNFTSVFNIGSASASSAWAWTYSGGEVARLTPTGLGIGTTNPTVRLHVVSSETGYASTAAEGISKATLLLKTHNSDSTLTSFGGTSGGHAYIQRTNGPGTTPYSILLNPFGGNVGVGTTTANQRLEVSDSSQSGIVYTRISNTFGSTTSNGAGTALQFYGWDAGITANIKSLREGSAYSPSYLSFETFGGNGTTNNNTLAERLRIDGKGSIAHTQGNSVYLKKTMITAGSAFDNPVVPLVTVNSGAQNQMILVKVRVLQATYGNSVGNEQIGMAGTMWNGSAFTSTTGTMAVSYNGGIANVGTLSWTGTSPNTLRYTTNRASNYDSYAIEVEVLNGNSMTVTLG